MNIFKNRFRVITLSLLLSFSLLGGVSLAQGAAENNNCNKSFSLYDALEEAGARDANNKVLIPRGLPGSAKSQNIGAEGAIKGFTGLIQRFINGLTAIAAAVAVFFIVFNGGSMMLAAGEEEKIKKAKTGVVWALLGLLLIMSSYIIAKTVISLAYSGSSEIVNDSNQFNKDCEPETAPAPTPDPAEVPAPASTPQACEAKDLAKNIPAVCYDGIDASAQTSTGASCGEEEFKEIFEFMEVSNLIAMQNKLGAGQPGTNYYTNPTASCSQADDKFGKCTRDALEKYLKEKCDESTGANETSG